MKKHVTKKYITLANIHVKTRPTSLVKKKIQFQYGDVIFSIYIVDKNLKIGNLKC